MTFIEPATQRGSQKQRNLNRHGRRSMDVSDTIGIPGIPMVRPGDDLADL